MPEKYTLDRIIFPTKGGQGRFLNRIKNEIGISWREIGIIINRHQRTIKDWEKEKYQMPHQVAQQLANMANIQLPKKIKIKKWKDHLSMAGQKGGLAVMRKNGGQVVLDEARRKKKWFEWWQKRGQFEKHRIYNSPLSIRIPIKSDKLAEYVGIMLGDGGISRYQLTITLHRNDDKEYSLYICNLIQELFEVIPKKRQQRGVLADDIIISRIALVRFCTEELGLVLGNKVKQQIDIPDWIKENNNFLRECVRGLVDTDGSVFTHKYIVKNKEYRYKKIQFTSRSEPLRLSLYNSLLSLGIKARLAKPPYVWIDSQSAVKKYFNIIGSHNPKHLIRYKR